MPKIKIEVNKFDILMGARFCPLFCPVSRAISREIGGYCRVSSNLVFDLKGIKLFKLPKEVIKFIDDFDKGKEVEPITFELEVNDSAN